MHSRVFFFVAGAVLAFDGAIFTNLSAHAQPAPQPYNLTLDAKQVEAIVDALQDKPFRASAPLIQAIAQQVQAQNAQRVGAPPMPPAPPPAESKQ